MQIEDYHGDKNPYIHSPNDSITHINAGYLLKQMQATAAFAGQLGVPVLPAYQVRIPYIWH